MKKATIITCCYNGETFIDECFSCVLNQTYPNIEFVFVDDGSKDNSFQKAESWREKFNQKGIEFKCIRQENKGAAAATAFGLTHTTGDYLSNLDVDDILYPSSIEKRVSFLEDNPSYDIVRTNGYKTSKDHQKTLFTQNEEEKKKEDIFEEILLGRTNNWPGSYMVRSSTLWKIYPERRIYESKYGQNMQILLAAAYKHKSGFIDEPLMEYRYNPQSFTNNRRDFNHEFRVLNGFKDIRVEIVKGLGIKDKGIYQKIDAYYYRLFMDLALRYHQKDVFVDSFESMSKLCQPADIYKYHYYKMTANKIRACYYRAKMLLKR